MAEPARWRLLRADKADRRARRHRRILREDREIAGKWSRELAREIIFDSWQAMIERYASA